MNSVFECIWTPIAKSQQFELGAVLSKSEKELLSKDITVLRQRLTDISWFMCIVSESIARQANSEDECTGRFSVTAPALLYLLHPCSRGRADLKARHY